MTTTFIKPERQISSNIKVERTEAGLEEDDLDPAVLDLFVTGDRVVFQLGARQTTNLDELKTTIENFENKSEGAFVRVGRHVEFDNAAKAIGLFKASGFANVSYLPAE